MSTVNGGDHAAVERAAALLRTGGLVAFPTETVYGLGADAGDPTALARIFAVKGRPADHPLIVHLADAAGLDTASNDVTEDARRLAKVFWPGPLTLVVPRGPAVDPAATGGRDTVGLRVPDHPVALELLRLAGVPVAAPSANRFGRVSPTTAAHVARDLDGDVDLIVDGGPCPVGVESTIIDCTVEPLMILRHGAITAEQIETVLDRTVDRIATGPSRASGMLESHYAPSCTVLLADDRAHAEALAARTSGHGTVEILDPGPDAEHWARHLYEWLRDADRRHIATLIAVPPPAEGLGLAVRDRLTKAAAPRPER